MNTRWQAAQGIPNLSQAQAAEIDEQPVLLNGMRVVFDQRVSVYPVNLDLLTPNDDDDDNNEEAGH